ncbi:MAG: V-type ATP synthase subunit F, partial [Candidatus Hadarchaeales archaeon]
MSYEIAVIGELETVIGMQLAGVKFAHVHSKSEETLEKLRELFARGDVGLVLITHRVAEELGPELRRAMREKGFLPIVLRIPDKSGWVPKSDELKEIIRRTVGAEVILK